MICRDVREMGDSFLCEELLTETNHEILRHLETCPSCRADIDARRRVRTALRDAFNRAAELQPSTDFQHRLRDRLREVPVDRGRPASRVPRWLALAAGLVLAAGLAGVVLMNRSDAGAEALALDAVGDHRNCALHFRLERKPVPLDQAAEQFDSAYRVLLDAPPDDVSMPDGVARVVERHSCAYAGRRFGHIVLKYRDRVVSLLMTANDGGNAIGHEAIPHVIGAPMDGLSVVSVDGSHHAVLLVGDLDSADLVKLSTAISVPLARRLDAAVRTDPDAVASVSERSIELRAIAFRDVRRWR